MSVDRKQWNLFCTHVLHANMTDVIRMPANNMNTNT